MLINKVYCKARRLFSLFIFVYFSVPACSGGGGVGLGCLAKIVRYVRILTCMAKERANQTSSLTLWFYRPFMITPDIACKFYRLLYGGGQFLPFLRQNELRCVNVINGTQCVLVWLCYITNNLKINTPKIGWIEKGIELNSVVVSVKKGIKSANQKQ